MRYSSPPPLLSWPAQLSAAILFLVVLVHSALADPVFPCLSCRTQGWWDAGPNWNHQAVHMMLMRGPSDTTDLMWWPDESVDGSVTHTWSVTPYAPLPPYVDLRTHTIPGTNIFCSGHSTLADGKLLVSGGDETNTLGIRDSWEYDPITRGWEPELPMKFARYYPTSTTLGNGEVLLSAGESYWILPSFGGRDGTGTLHQDMDGVFPLMEKPSRINDLPTTLGTQPAVREGHTAIFIPVEVSAGSLTWPRRMIVFGGTNGTIYFNDLWELTRDDNELTWTWRPLTVASGSSPPQRAGHSAIFVPEDNSIVIFGGKNGSQTFRDVWRFKLGSATAALDGVWEEIATGFTQGPSISGHAVVYDNTEGRSSMYVFGGQSFGGVASSIVYQLKNVASGSESPQWIQPPVTNDPDDGNPGPLANPAAALSTPADTSYGAYIFAPASGSTNQIGVWRLRIRTHVNTTGYAAGDNALHWVKVHQAVTSPVPLARTGQAVVYDYNRDRFVMLGGTLTDNSVTGEVWTFRLPPQYPDSRYGKSDNLQWVLASNPTDATQKRTGMSLIYDTREFIARIAERYKTDDTWEHIGDAYFLPNYPYMFLLPSGNLYFAGPKLQQALLNVTMDGSNFAWSELPTSTNSPAYGGSAVMFQPGRVMKCGNVGPYGTDAGKQTMSIDLTANEQTAQWVTNSDMAQPRTQHNLVNLPNGDVKVTGGLEQWEHAEFPAKRPQVWSPTTGVWSDTVLAAEPYTRDYHSTALLLPDGRILTAGGDRDPTDRLCPAIFWPPYLFDSNGNLTSPPIIQGVPALITWGRNFKLCATDPSHITRVALVRPGAVTHTFDQNQRYVALTPTTSCNSTHATGGLTISGPASANVAPPGDYLLFIIRDDGVPSVGRWVRVGGTYANDPLCSCAAGCPVVDVSRDGEWQVENTVLGRSATGDLAIDALDLGPIAGGGELGLRIRENEAEYTTLDHAELQIVDHISGEEVFASGGKLVLGTTVAAAKVTTQSGEDITRLLAEGAEGYTGRAGAVLEVEFDPPGVGDAAHAGFPQADGGTGAAHTLTSGGGGGAFTGGGKPNPEEGGDALSRGPEGRGPVTDAAVLSQTGILIEVPDGLGGWTEKAHWYPREFLSEFALDSLGSQARLVFLTQHTITAIGKLVVSNRQPTVTVVQPSTAVDARRGDALPALEAIGDGLDMQIAPGDTVMLTFTVPSAPSGTVRAAYLVTHGAYTSTPQQAINALPGRRSSGEATSALNPTAFALHANRPNPFGHETRIGFDLPSHSRVRIEIFNASGRLIRTLSDREWDSGRWTVTWDRSDARGIRVPRGVYMYRDQAGAAVAERRMTVLF